MKLLKNLALFLLFILCLLSSASADHSGRFDPTAVWPLCGRISENPPAGWNPLQPDCPAQRWGDPDFTDAPISSTFGPRQQASGSFHYDYHRGLDLPTPSGTPVFAVADGVVLRVGSDPDYVDTVVQIEHTRPGHSDCSSGCYYSNYLHLLSWEVALGDVVSKGQHIADSGPGLSGFEHLHFEIREAPGDHDSKSAWQRDTVHPLLMLPYPDTGAANMTVSIDNVDVSNPLNPLLTVSVSMPNNEELDLNRIEVEVYEKDPNLLPQLIPQPGSTPVGNTPEGTGYDVNPPWFDMMQFNRQYSYKDSTFFPWTVFESGGLYESPFALLLPATYDPNIHLDQNGGVGDETRGHFNGLVIAPAPFNTAVASYDLTLTFNQLIGSSNAQNLCLRARAEDTAGSVTPWLEFKCGGIILTPTTGLTMTAAGGAATFTLVLSRQPTADVMVDLSGSDTSGQMLGPVSLAFTPVDWNVVQTATITGINTAPVGGDVASAIFSGAAVSTDLNYAGLVSATAIVTSINASTVGITLNSISGLATTEAGGVANFTVVLDSGPVTDVSLDLSSSDASEGKVSPASLNFTDSNWSVPQTVTVTGVDDAVVDGDVTYTVVTDAAISGDPHYNGIDPADVDVVNRDNDSAVTSPSTPVTIPVLSPPMLALLIALFGVLIGRRLPR